MKRISVRLRPAGLCAMAVIGTIALTLSTSARPQSDTIEIYVRASASYPGNGLSWATAFQKLEDAIAIAQPGQPLWVATGSYTAPSLGYLINKKLRLFGGFKGDESSLAGRFGDFAGTVLNGAGGRVVDIVDVNLSPSVSTPGVVLDGFTITNGSTGGSTLEDLSGAGIRCRTTDLDIANLYVKFNTAYGNGGGLYFYRSGSGGPKRLHMKKCEFNSNVSQMAALCMRPESTGMS